MEQMASYSPVTFWITVLAWLCCSAVWWLTTVIEGWWIVVPAIALISFSFTVAIVRDLAKS